MNSNPVVGGARRCLCLMLLTALAACSGVDRATQQSPARQMLEKQAVEVLRMRPSLATRMGLTDEDLGIRVNDAMDNYNSTHMREWRRSIRAMRQELRALPEGALDPLTRDAMDDVYSQLLGASEIPFGFIDSYGRHRPYVINQIDHPLAYIPDMMVNFQRLQNAEDVGDYLRRMWALSELVAGVLSKFNEDASAGWLPPKPVLQGGLVFIEEFTSVPPEEHRLVTHLLDTIERNGILTEEERAKVRNEAIAVMYRVVYPSYRNAAKEVRERLPQATTQAGLWARPRGEQFYQRAIVTEARTRKDAEKIHDIGLAEVARILGEMDRKLKALGLNSGSVAERMRGLAREKRFLYADTDEGRAALIERVRGVAKDMESRLPDYSGRLPGQAVEIRRVPVELQAGKAMGYYSGPPADGKGPGTFWLNLRAMDELPWFQLPTLTYHETVPGHHLQIALARTRSDRPSLWRYTTNSAFSEGWALYAERLAWEMGVYEDAPYADLGRLQDELLRAARLVVDTGLHYKRWSMSKAISYMAETTGKGEAEVRAETVRYMATPAQALSYKLGMMAILEMREAARASMGEEFVLADFHDKVLATGPVSMPLLKREIGTWSAR